jgi:hypothetical protein
MLSVVTPYINITDSQSMDSVISYYVCLLKVVHLYKPRAKSLQQNLSISRKLRICNVLQYRQQVCLCKLIFVQLFFLL